jgi:2-oxoisovalerate dehydrogenase E2 component (dihydrolipoyl transacylase)
MPQLTMPNVGEGVTEGTVTRWLKAEGDDVALDEPVVEVETDKAVVEIPSPFEGKLTQILVQEGEVVPIGAPLADFSGAEATDEAAAVSATPTTETVVDAAREEQVEEPAAVTAATPARSANGAVASPGEPRRKRQYSPVVLKLATEHNIDLALVQGTGIEGRVTRQDVMRYLENPALHTVAPPSSAGVVGVEREAKTKVQQPAPPSSGRGEGHGVRVAGEHPASDGDTTTPLTPTRRTIAARMLESHQTIPVAWMVVEADVTGLVALRARAKEEFAGTEGVKLTYMPFFVQAIVAALKQHRAINASYTEAGIMEHAAFDMGIAVATESGLVVPVVRDAGDRSIAGLARELDALGAKARARKLTLDEMRGATLTIDNTGAFGSILSQPIVPAGQVAIITTEAIRRELRPVGGDRAVAGDAFGPRSVMNLCISFDHRALDGAEAGAFMQAVKSNLESYAPGQPVF